MLVVFMFNPLISSLLQPPSLLPVAKNIYPKYLSCRHHCVEACHSGHPEELHKNPLGCVDEADGMVYYVR